MTGLNIGVKIQTAIKTRSSNYMGVANSTDYPLSSSNIPLLALPLPYPSWRNCALSLLSLRFVLPSSHITVFDLFFFFLAPIKTEGNCCL